jgi:phosphoribosylanthranilate isomerase
VKICGVTRPSDADAAADAGADAVGMVFYAKSPRCVTPDRAAQIVASLPALVTPVALFVNESPAAIRQTASALGIATVQLHGDETPEFVAELAPLRVIKAIGVRADSLASDLARWRVAIARLTITNLAALLMDSPAGAEAGGTGVTNDFGAAAVAVLRPWAVDVSTGVEIVKGQKSPEKIADFIEQVRHADQVRHTDFSD